MSDQPVSDPNVPAVRLAVDNSQLSNPSMPMSLQILFNKDLFQAVNQMATIMAGDNVFTPSHLRGKPQACHTVITMALQWKLDISFAARCTYMTPGGSVGFEGKLVQSILENSNRFIGAPEFEYCGDWNKVTSKFVKATSQKGNEYIKPSWTATDAEGCGITMRWRVRGEEKPRVWPSEEMPFYLTQCFPLNSPLWASDPRSQIRYLVIRRFADQSAPGILAGMPFDPEDMVAASDMARDITHEAATPPPRPTRESVAAPPVTDYVEPEPEPENPPYAVTSYTGDTEYFDDPKSACENWFLALTWAEKEYGSKGLEAVWESNSELYAALDANLFSDLSAIVRSVYQKRHEATVAGERLSETAGTPNPAPAATVAPQTAEPPPAPSTGTGRPVPGDQDIPFPDDGRRIVPPGTPATGRPEMGGLVPRDKIWDGDDLSFAPPQIRGLADWTGYTNRFRRLIGETRDPTELDALFQAHSDNLIALSTAQPRSYQRIADEAGQKHKEFESER